MRFILILHCVFHGISFKVRGLVVERQLIFIFYIPFPSYLLKNLMDDLQ